MAFDHNNIPASIQGPADIPGLQDFLAKVLPEKTGLQLTLVAKKATGTLLSAKSIGANPQDIQIWVCNNAVDPEKAGITIVYKTAQNPFQDVYALNGAPEALIKADFWNNSWLLYTNLNGYTLPSEFMEAARNNKIDLGSKQLTLSLGMNIVHEWNLKDALSGLQLGPFEGLIPQDDTKSLLLANEQAEGMMFSLLLDVKDGIGFSSDFIKKILKANWACFSLCYPFSDSDLQIKKAEVSANVTLFDTASATLEATFKSNADAELELAIYPDKAFDLGGGLSNLFDLLDLGKMPTLVPPDLPAALALQHLRLNVSAKGIESFSVDLALKAENLKDGWVVVKDLFTLYGIYLRLDWQKGGRLSFQTEGVMNALGYDFLLSYAHPANIISARFAPGAPTEKSIGDITKAVGFPDGLNLGPIDGFKAADLSMYADLEEKELEIRLKYQQASGWQLGGFIDINAIDLRFECYNNWSFSGASLSLELELPIGKNAGENKDRENVSVSIDAEYDKNNKLWSFEGETGSGQDIAVGDAINALSKKVGGTEFILPDAVRTLVVRNIYLEFDNQGNAEFTCETAIDIEGQELDFWVQLKRSTDKTIQVAGSLFVAGVRLGVAFQSDKNSKTIIGSLQVPMTLSTKELIEAIAPSIAENVPFEVDFLHKALLLAIQKDESQSNKYLFRLSFDLNVDLKPLPLIGNLLPADLKFTNGLLLATNKDWADTDVSEINDLLSVFPAPAPTALGVSRQDNAGAAISRGISLGMSFQISDKQGIPLVLRMGGNQQKASQDNTGTPAPKTNGSGAGAAMETSPTASGVTPAPQGSAASGIQWVTVAKNFGPVQFKRLGFQFEPAQRMLWAYIEAGLSAGPLKFTLNGLGMGTPINHFEPEFRLLGIGVEYQSGPVEIGASFLRARVQASGTLPEHDEYSGLALIKTPTLALSAIGSYVDLPDYQSLFIYASLNKPIGGPAFFFVTGLTAGFGFNRALKTPDISRVAEFPLVKLAQNGSANASVEPAQRPDYLSGILDQLRDSIYPAEGQFFLAAGVRFSSFRMINSFALLMVRFDKRFEVDVLGLSTAVIPAPTPGAPTKTPLAVIQMAIKAVFIPEDGFLGVSAQLTGNSYILDKNCRLTGGFAFYTWFSGPHEGDFVISAGGYHPQFRKPEWYPDVPRLGLHWQLSNELSVKGSMYFALCPHALMAGGRLEASFKSGAIKAWFILGIDFIMGWKPFYYDAKAYLEIGVEYTFHFFGAHTISVSLNADVHVWGPDFGGHAHVSLWCVSFDIDFGARTLPKVSPLTWTEFRDSFLPDGKELLNLNVSGGLLKTQPWDKIRELHIVNPKDFELTVNLVIPAKEITGCSGKTSDTIMNTGFGIAPMGMNASEIKSRVDIAVERFDPKDNTWSDAGPEFNFRPILKNMPAALWGERLQVDVNGKQTIENVIAGLQLIPANPPNPGVTQWVKKADLQFTTTEVKRGISFETIEAFNLTGDQDGYDLQSHLINSQDRVKILEALGFGAQEVDIKDDQAKSLVMYPQIGQLAG